MKVITVLLLSFLAAPVFAQSRAYLVTDGQATPLSAYNSPNCTISIDEGGNLTEISNCNIDGDKAKPLTQVVGESSKPNGLWTQTDNALIRAQQRKKFSNSSSYFVFSGYTSGISDADAMSEIYTLASHEICGTVTAYEETPDVIHYQSKVRNDQGLKWKTKDAAEKFVEEDCDPKPAGSWQYYINGNPALGGEIINTPAITPWVNPVGSSTITY
jgi:hypothetical protein